MSYAQVIFLRGKTHQITSLQNIFKLLLKFTGLNSNLSGEFANTVGFLPASHALSQVISKAQFQISGTAAFTHLFIIMTLFSNYFFNEV